MTSGAGMRVLVLAGAALLGVTIALAVSNRHDHAGQPQAAVTPAGQWYTATAGPYIRPLAKKGACGVVVSAKTPGVSHPVLPCGAKVYLELNGHQVLTEVVDHGHAATGHAFGVTPPVAKLLGLDGTQTIRWRFAS